MISNENDELRSKNKAFEIENDVLKNKLNIMKGKIDILENIIASLKIKSKSLLNNVSKFSIKRKTLDVRHESVHKNVIPCENGFVSAKNNKKYEFVIKKKW